MGSKASTLSTVISADVRFLRFSLLKGFHFLSGSASSASDGKYDF